MQQEARVRDVLVALVIAAGGVLWICNRGDSADDDDQAAPPAPAAHVEPPTPRVHEQPEQPEPEPPKPRSRRDREPSAEDYREAASIYKDLQKLLAASKKMERLRHSDNLDDLRRCGERMHELLPKAEALEERSEPLPLELMEIGVAATYMKMCVTCVPDAKFHCEQAAFFMKGAHESLPKKWK